jgi:hypothetical protein
MSRIRSFQIAASVAALVFSGSLFAAGPSGDRSPTYIEVTADGAIIVEASPAWDNPDGCTDPFRIFIPASNVHLDKYYAATLTAYAGGDQLWAWVDGCRRMGWGEEYPVVKNMAIRRR